MKLRTILGAGASATALVCDSAFAQDRSWTGSAGDGKWSTPDNWLGVTAPVNGDAVSFGEALGGTLTLDMDIANLSLLSLGYISGAGSYTVSGGALGITSALTSDASAVQTISAPVNLGAANAGSVTVGGVGAIDLTGVTSFQGKELVKTGTGVFTTTDGAVFDKSLETEFVPAKLPYEIGYSFLKPETVRANRVIWSDGGYDPKDGLNAGPVRYRVLIRTADGRWMTAVDASENDRDLLADYRELFPARAVAARLEVLGAPSGITPRVVEWTLFGERDMISGN